MPLLLFSVVLPIPLISEGCF